MVRVDRFDASSNTYKVTVLKEEAVGPIYTRTEELVKSIGFSEPMRLKKKPNLIVGNEYQIDVALPTLTATGLAKRKKEVQQH